MAEDLRRQIQEFNERIAGLTASISAKRAQITALESRLMEIAQKMDEAKRLHGEERDTNTKLTQGKKELHDLEEARKEAQATLVQSEQEMRRAA